VTLRTRLLLAFLTLALVPTVVLALFALDRLGRAIELWNAPGVDHALESALETTKASVSRMEAIALAQAEEWAARLPDEGPGAAERKAAQAALRANGLDFLQVYRRADPQGAGPWQRVEDLRPSGVLAVTPLDVGTEIDAALSRDRILRSSSGALAGLALEGGRRVVVVGIQLPPDFFTEVERVGDGMSFYRRFRVVRDVSRIYTVVLVIALAALLVGISAWASALLARDMTRPLDQLGDAVERVAAGDLAVRVDARGATEVARLGARFNDMAARLGAAQAALLQAEREAAWREVARRLAHEFKNILTPMSLSLHRLQRRADVVPEPHRGPVAESLESFDDGVRQLSRLAAQFSQYARLPEPRLEATDLTRIVREAVRLHEHEGVEVRVVESAQPVWVKGDGLLLSRAIHNLVLNACEASGRSGVVEVCTVPAASEGAVEVKDRGPGLAPEVRNRLFEPYVSTKNRGSGLGLSLVRDVALQHGGRITLEDREGGGTLARLVLPRLATPTEDGSA